MKNNFLVQSIVNFYYFNKFETNQKKIFVLKEKSMELLWKQNNIEKF